MNSYEFAERELGNCITDEEINMIPLILQVLRGLQDYSPETVLGVIRTAYRLAQFKPIYALTGEEDEWDLVNPATSLYQNKHCPLVFKQNDRAWIVIHNVRYPIGFPYFPPTSEEMVYYR